MKDSVVTVQKTYRADTLLSSEKYTTWFSFNRITNWEKRDSNGELKSEMRVKYDKMGNAVAYYFSRGVNRTRGGAPVNIRIKNTYDKRKLLLNRFYYTVNNEGKLKTLAKIERFIYDQNPLIYRYQKGDLIQEGEGNAIH